MKVKTKIELFEFLVHLKLSFPVCEMFFAREWFTRRLRGSAGTPQIYQKFLWRKNKWVGKMNLPGLLQKYFSSGVTSKCRLSSVGLFSFRKPAKNNPAKGALLTNDKSILTTEQARNGPSRRCPYSLTYVSVASRIFSVLAFGKKLRIFFRIWVSAFGILGFFVFLYVI